ncbi:hypothetical protein PInf_010187 [Phytophthora infestans]|nr:hypothetical protein PInf_010187 [Phytophthora infestans]
MKIKTKVQASMARRQERLYAQRRQFREVQNRNEEQWKIREGRSSRVTDWWRHDGDDGGTGQGSTSSSTSSGELLVDGTNTSESGSQHTNTNVSIKTVGSWKNLQLGKSCNKYDTDVDGKAVTYCDTGEFGDATEYDGSFTANNDADVNDDADVYDGADVTNETVVRQSTEAARNGRYGRSVASGC